MFKDLFKHKYNVSAPDRRTVDEIVFDSMIESEVYVFIRDNFKKGTWSRQPKYELQPKFRDKTGKVNLPITYSGDFLVPKDNVVIDVKGFSDQKFALKKKMFLFHNREMELIEVKTVRDVRELAEKRGWLDPKKAALLPALRPRKPKKKKEKKPAPPVQ